MVASSYGNTSSISKLNLTTNVQSTVFSGGPSLAGAGGGDATGFTDIAFVGNTAYAVIGFGTDPAELRTGLGQLTAALDELGRTPAAAAAHRPSATRSEE